MVARTEYFDAINESDSALAERVRSLRDEAKKLVRVRKTAKLTIEKARDQIAAKEQRLEATRSTLESREGALLSARAERRQALNSVQGERDEHEEVAADLRAEIAQEIAEATGGVPLPAGPLPSPAAPPGSSGRSKAPSPQASATAGGGCTRGSTSPCRKGRRSAPRPTAP